MNDRNFTTTTEKEPIYEAPNSGQTAGEEALTPAMGIDPQSLPRTDEQTTGAASLLSSDTANSYRDRWTTIQGEFVDEPKDAVRKADGLVSDVIQELAQRFSEERQGLESQWDGGSEVSTEDLRMALRHYRDFFQRLLAA